VLLLFGFVHQFYDLLVLVLPLCVGIGWLLERQPVAVLDRVRWLCAAFPTVHVHRVSTNIVPGLTTTGADRIDTGVLIVAAVLSLAATLRRPPADPSGGEPAGASASSRPDAA
jgi:hypothetical protein